VIFLSLGRLSAPDAGSSRFVRLYVAFGRMFAATMPASPP
jgi:hypothetical protein